MRVDASSLPRTLPSQCFKPIFPFCLIIIAQFFDMAYVAELALHHFLAYCRGRRMNGHVSDVTDASRSRQLSSHAPCVFLSSSLLPNSTGRKLGTWPRCICAISAESIVSLSKYSLFHVVSNMFLPAWGYAITIRDTGHTNCAGCINRYVDATRSTRGTYPCPSCRKAFKRDQAHAIYLECVDSPSQTAVAGTEGHERVCHPDSLHKQVASALREVVRLEEDQRRQTVQRAAAEMEKVSELMDSRDCLLVST